MALTGVVNFIDSLEIIFAQPFNRWTYGNRIDNSKYKKFWTSFPEIFQNLLNFFEIFRKSKIRTQIFPIIDAK
jgi:hypothetical protein